MDASQTHKKYELVIKNIFGHFAAVLTLKCQVSGNKKMCVQFFKHDWQWFILLVQTLIVAVQK